MRKTNFQEYYLNSLVRDPNKDYAFDDSDKWFKDHSAITSKGSLAIGIIEEQESTSFRNFIDIDILPKLFETIKKNTESSIVFLTKETNTEKYVYESLCKKFPQIKIQTKKSTDNIISDIRKLELENKIALTIMKSNEIYSSKYIIEYI